MPVVTRDGKSDIRDLLESMKAESSQKATQSDLTQIKQSLETIIKKLDRHDQNLNKLISMISKMHQDGELNKDTFNRLDQFLHDWLDTTL